MKHVTVIYINTYEAKKKYIESRNMYYKKREQNRPMWERKKKKRYKKIRGKFMFAVKEQKRSLNKSTE